MATAFVVAIFLSLDQITHGIDKLSWHVILSRHYLLKPNCTKLIPGLLGLAVPPILRMAGSDQLRVEQDYRIMTIKDPFSYSARWSSVGLDCSNCVHFVGPAQWPDHERVSRCALHKISLALELNPKGFKEGEWFCKEFTNNGEAFTKAIIELETVKDSLQESVLYGAYGEGRILKEYPFACLEK